MWSSLFIWHFHEVINIYFFVSLINSSHKTYWLQWYNTIYSDTRVATFIPSIAVVQKNKKLKTAFAEFYPGPASTPTSCASSPRGEEPASPHGGALQPTFFHHQPYHRPFFSAGRRGPGRPRKDGPKLTREGKIVRRLVVRLTEPLSIMRMLSCLLSLAEY